MLLVLLTSMLLSIFSGICREQIIIGCSHDHLPPTPLLWLILMVIRVAVRVPIALPLDMPCILDPTSLLRCLRDPKSNPQSLSLPLRLNITFLVTPLLKPFGFESCYMTWGLYSIKLSASTVTMSVQLICLLIQLSMIAANKLLLITTLFVKGFLPVILSFVISLLVHRLLIYLLKDCH